MFPNKRMGWHKRKTRDYCLSVFEQYKGLDFETFTGLVRSFFGYDENVDSSLIYQEPQAESGSSFAQRLITGLAAERYFESIHTELPEFDGYLMENKGLKEQHGSLSMTPKEYDVASILRDRFFLFVVRNFRESPFHEIFKNPLAANLEFKKIERVTIQVSWLTNV